MNMGWLSNTVSMATFTRFLLKITEQLIDKICYYASRMDEPSLNDSKNMWFFKTIFKCILVDLLQNDVSPFYQPGTHLKIDERIMFTL